MAITPGNYIIARLAVQGAQEFLRDLGRARHGFREAGQAAIDFAQGVAKLTILGTISSLALSAYVAFRSLLDILSDVAVDAFNAAASFQVLTIRMEGLLARQARAEDSTLAIGDAYAIASRQVEKYLDWIKEVAVTTPFEVETLANIFSLAQAYGFTAGEAQTLVLAIGNFTAGMGLSNEVMQRIIENFGQMRAAGKVTGTELRDLARGAFLPVNDILQRMADNLGIAGDQLDEFKDQAREGGVSVDEFFRAFIEIANEDFPDAMNRMARTWTGVLSNVKDFIKTVLGVEILGPLLNRFGEIAANVLNHLLAPAVRNNARWIGEFLLVAFDKLWGALTQQIIPGLTALARAFGFTVPEMTDFISVLSVIVNFLVDAAERFRIWAETVGSTIASTFTNIVSNAFSWGANIAASIAEGLISGASNFIVGALNYIGDLLSYWLSPGSPPRIAPDIDLWGSEAFKEYLEGFTMTDFSILKSLQGPLKQALDIFASLGAITDKEAGSLFVGFSEDIAAFLETGLGGGNLFADLTAQLGEFGTEMGELLEKQLALLEATKALEAAEKALEEARKAQDLAIEKVNTLKDEYNALLRAGADPAILEAKLAEINAAEEARAAAIEETKEAEAAVEAAEERLEPLEEAVKLQQELLAQLIEIQRALIDITKETGKGGGLTFEPGEFGGIPEFDPLDEKAKGKLEKDWADLFDRLGEQLKAKLAGLWQENIVDPFNDAVGRIGTSWDTAMTNIRNAWNTAWRQITTAPLFVTFADFFQDRIDSAQRIWEQWGPRLTTAIQDAWAIIRSTFSERLAGIGELIRFTQNRWEQFWDEHGGKILAKLSPALDKLGALWDRALANITGNITLFAEGLVRWWNIIKDDIDRWWNNAMDTLKKIIDNAFDALGGLIDLFIAVTERDWEGVKKSLTTIWKAAWDSITEIFDLFKNDFLGADGLLMGLINGIVEMFTGYESWDEMGKAIIDGILTGLEAKKQEVLDWLVDLAQAAIDAILAGLSGDVGGGGGGGGWQGWRWWQGWQQGWRRGRPKQYPHRQRPARLDSPDCDGGRPQCCPELQQQLHRPDRRHQFRDGRGDAGSTDPARNARGVLDELCCSGNCLRGTYLSAGRA